MKRVATQENSFWKRFLINIPFVLMIALMIACFGGFLLLAFYSIVTAVAFHSAMIYLIVAGASAILLGIGLGMIVLFKKYYAFYNKKMGWKFVKDDTEELDNAKNEKTITYDDKKPFVQIVKKYLTVSNVSIAVLALGAVFAIISAALGSIDRANWVNEVGSYREERGYFKDVEYLSIRYDATDLNRIELVLPPDDIRNKDIVVIYTKSAVRQNFVWIEGYQKFENDVACARKDSTVSIFVSEAPPLGTALNNLVFFIFGDYYVEKQILVYIPYDFRDKIEIPDAKKIIYEEQI